MNVWLRPGLQGVRKLINKFKYFKQIGSHMAQNVLETSVKENLIKNLCVLVLAFLLYNNIYLSLNSIDSIKIGSFLSVISMLLVTVCFANFAFSYEHTDITKLSLRLLSHTATFIFMLLLALLLETLVISIRIVYPSLFSITLIFSILLYLGVGLYDFWDLFRSFKHSAE